MQKASLYVMSVLYIAAGLNHFWHPKPYRRIMPPWLPWHSALVMLSGLLEVVLGLLLLFPATRQAAAWGLIVLLIAVFPANVQMALMYAPRGGGPFLLALMRLPLQALLIWWAYLFTK